MRICVPLLLLACSPPLYCLTIDEHSLAVSTMVPREGQEVTWTLSVVNDSAHLLTETATILIRSQREADGSVSGGTVEAELRLQAGESAEVSVPWTPERNGTYRVAFALAGGEQVIERRVAVTARDTYFVWFGAPQRFAWCNVPTTVKPEDRDWWLRRGAIPAAWKCGVCCKDKTVEEFVEIWGAADHIAIDEVGGPGEVTDKFIEAWKRLRRDKPGQWVAVWYMGAHDYWADIKDLVDLFLPEIYLNYSGNHLGKFDAYFRTARRAGVMDQVIPGLGINVIKDEAGNVTNSPTKEDVLRQFRYLKRTAPELRGIGFFTSDSAAPGVAEYADALCEDYYIKPVLTVEGLPEAIHLTKAPGDERGTATAVIRNVGGMDAHNVKLRWHWDEAGLPAAATAPSIGMLRAGDRATVTLDIRATRCCQPLGLSIEPDLGYTVLDGRGETTVLHLPAETDYEAAVAVPPPPAHPAAVPLFASVNGPGPYALHGADDTALRPVTAPCALLPPRPGTDEKLVAFPLVRDLPTGGMAVLRQEDAGRAPSGITTARDGSVLSVRNEFYEARLDLSTDAIVSLSPVGGMANVLASPWVFNAPGREGFGEAKVEELPGCVVVTVPYDSATASGASQYVFFSYSPAIRIARDWRPRGEAVVGYAGERCNLLQRGGGYALQPGVGGPVRRGELRDSSDYRDLLFGYLGEAPGPYTADRAGWLDMSYGAEDCDGGLGVAIEYRWDDGHSREYDVTRLYDAADWLEVLHVWGEETTISRPQKSCIYLIPHRALPLAAEGTVAPAQALWSRLHRGQLLAIGEPVL